MSLARTSDALYWAALGIYIAATGFHFLSLRRSSLAKVAVGITVAGWGAHLGMLLTRAFAAGRVPWGNMYEYSTVMVFLLVSFSLIALSRRPSLRSVFPFAMLLAVVSMSLARGLYVQAGPLQPALNSWWLKIHVISAITASSIFSIAFVFTVLYLIKDRAERRALFTGSTVGAAYAGSGVIDQEADGGFPRDHVSEDPDVAAAAAAASGERHGFVARLPKSGTLDQWSYRLTAIAFPIWTWAVFAGAIWASKAWGRYWGWDPKETWAFITWVVYAGYLHARATSGWRGRRAAYINGAGFVALWICYYAVNLWISGLHSYKNG